MNVPRYALAAARFLSGRLSENAPPPGDRARGVENIERAMRARGRKTRLRWGLAALSAAAALLSVWFATRSTALDSRRSAASVSIVATPAFAGASLRAGNHRARELHPASELTADQAIETSANGGASLRLSTGTRLELAEFTAFRVDDRGPTQRFALSRGELTAEVAKLAAGKRFIVTTPDAEIEVRGTRFRLRVLPRTEACSPTSRTRLEVTEGLVEVRSAGTTSRVAGGQLWPSGCSSTERAEPSRPEGEAPAARANAAPASESDTPPPVAPRSQVPARDASSALTRQNDLFAEAVALRRRGDVAGALAAYQRLIAQFPGSPLVENALVERMRLLAGSERGRAEAERYLARYPDGFAAEDARQLLGRR